MKSPRLWACFERIIRVFISFDYGVYARLSCDCQIGYVLGHSIKVLLLQVTDFTL